MDVTPSPSPGPPLPLPTHELPPGLALGWAGSCFTMGETMVGCGMPEGCSPWAGGGTMCGEKRLDIRLQRGEREAPSAPHGCRRPGSTPNAPENLRRRLREHRPQPVQGLPSRERPPVLAAWYPSPGDIALHPRGPSPGIFGQGGHRSLPGPGCTHAEVSEHPRPALLRARVPHRPQGSGQNPAPAWGHPRGSLVPAESHLDTETHLDTGTHLDMEAFMARAG